MKYLTVSQPSHCLKHFITTFCFKCICSIVPPHSKLVLVQYASQHPLGLKADPSFTAPNIQGRCCVFFINIEFFRRHRRIATSNFWNGHLVATTGTAPQSPQPCPIRSSSALHRGPNCDGGGVVRNISVALRNTQHLGTGQPALGRLLCGVPPW